MLFSYPQIFLIISNDYLLKIPTLSVLQVLYLKDDQVDEGASTIKGNYTEWVALLKDKQTLLATFVICICTSSMAVLEPCVPMWLLAHLNPPPSRWQLGAIFIPDSIGYFIGSHFAGENFLPITKNNNNLDSKKCHAILGKVFSNKEKTKFCFFRTATSFSLAYLFKCHGPHGAKLLCFALGE